MQAHRAQMAKDMKTVLRLRPDQEGAWSAFEAAMAPPHRDRPPGPPEGPKADLTTPQRLDMMDKVMAGHEAHRAKAEAATRAFYGALSPEQQQVFDALMRLKGHRGGPGHGMGMRGPGMMRGRGGPGGPPPF
jgi:protein CpxP